MSVPALKPATPGSLFITATPGCNNRSPQLRLSNTLMRRLDYPARVTLARHPSGHYALVGDETDDDYSRAVVPPKYKLSMTTLANLLPGPGRYPVRMDCIDGRPAAIITAAED